MEEKKTGSGHNRLQLACQRYVSTVPETSDDTFTIINVVTFNGGVHRGIIPFRLVVAINSKKVQRMK